MAKYFGDDGFAIYQLPTGSRTAVEDFKEFGKAFQVFKETKTFTNEIRTLINVSKLPLLCVEGETDCDYLRAASNLLNRNDVLEYFELFAAGSDSRLNKIETSLKVVPEPATKKVVLLHDPEDKKRPRNIDDRIYRRKMPKYDNHPLSKGIENLFDSKTIEKARRSNSQFIDVREAVKTVTRGVEGEEPRICTVNKDEKRNLCNWLCENGTSEDFRHFGEVFDTLNEIIKEFEAI